MTDIDPYVYDAELVRVVDGDTVYFRLTKVFRYEVDFGFYIKETIESKKSTVMSFRLYGINTPELRGVPLEEKERGYKAKEELERLLGLGSLKVKTYKPDKYGRYLVDIVVYPKDEPPIQVNQTLVDNGFAVPYMRNQ